jgi:DNA repair protein RadC
VKGELTVNEGTKRVDIVTIQLVKEASLKYRGRTISNPQCACELVRDFLGERWDREYFGIICLNIKNQPTHISLVSIGSLNSSVVHPREVFKAAILSNSASIILFHNHPSGNPEPSKTDMDITKRLVEVGEIIGINIIDHVIVGDEQFMSMKEKMLL